MQVTCPHSLYQSRCESSVDLDFSGDEVWSRGRRLSPLLQQPCTRFPHACISTRFRANSAGGK